MLIRHRILSVRLMIVLAVVAGGLLSVPATAQFGEGAGFNEVMNPYYLRRDLVLFEQHLGLDSGQAMIIENLFYDYEAEQDDGRARMVERFEEMREEIVSAAQDRDRQLQLVFVPFEERAEDWNRLNDEFIRNVQAILNQQQHDRWPDFQCTMRREKELPKGRLSGEQVNLLHMLRELDVKPAQMDAIGNTIDDYTRELDHALESRVRLFRDTRFEATHAIRAQDIEDAIRIYGRQIDARVAVREVNDRYTQQITVALPGELGATFRQETLLRAYPRIYRPTAAQRIFDSAKKMTDLSEETLEAVLRLEQQYLAELRTINDRLLTLTRQYEPEDMVYRGISRSMAGRSNRPDPPDNPTRAEYERRMQLDRRYVELLRALLTPEEFGSIAGSRRFSGHPGAPAQDGHRKGEDGMNRNPDGAGRGPKSQTLSGAGKHRRDEPGAQGATAPERKREIRPK